MAELPIAEFLRTRLKEYDSKFEVRKGTAFDDLFFKPMQYVLQPFRDEADEIKLGQSLRRILKTDDPDSFNEEMVDDILSNVYVYRYQGGTSSGVARIYYDSPVDREYPGRGLTITGNNGKNYVNPAVFLVTEGQMSSQIEDGLYYFDIPIVSEELGEDTELEAESLVSVVGDTDVISVTNKLPILGGKNRETNTEIIERAKQSITVRDLVTGKGVQAILTENFPGVLTKVQPIGLGDKEMMRDILFNTHVGGKVDVYVKTNNVRRGSKDFYGVLVDTTRASPTTTQFSLPPNEETFLGQTSIDRSLGSPEVYEVKDYEPARFFSSVNMSTPINLSSAQYIRITIDGETRTIRVAGRVESQTTRQEILFAINNAFGVDVAFPYSSSIRLQSPTEGKGSVIVIESPPPPLNSALIPVFGDPSPSTVWVAEGDGPIKFTEDVDYTISDIPGTITATSPTPVSSGFDITTNGTALVPSNLLQADYDGFSNIGVGALVKTQNGPEIGTYRVIKKIDDATVEVDYQFEQTHTYVGSSEDFIVYEGGIKPNELILVKFHYNPVSIDIGKLIKLDEYGRFRGVRPGRENFTITDLALLRIVSVEAIDAVSGEPLDIEISGKGGYGLGGYGSGPYGIGTSADYWLRVNEPTQRFSMFEDSYIVFKPEFQGYSFRITYDYVPEIENMHTFCRSDAERVLDGDVLVKHLIPAYVSGVIEYSADDTDSSIPNNDSLIVSLSKYINEYPVGRPLEISDVTQYLQKLLDPAGRFTSFIKPITLYAEIHNTDGVITMIKDNTALTIPEEDPFPMYTTRPLTPRIAHWIVEDLQLVRL